MCHDEHRARLFEAMPIDDLGPVLLDGLSPEQELTEEHVRLMERWRPSTVVTSDQRAELMGVGGGRRSSADFGVSEAGAVGAGAAAGGADPAPAAAGRTAALLAQKGAVEATLAGIREMEKMLRGQAGLLLEHVELLGKPAAGEADVVAGAAALGEEVLQALAQMSFERRYRQPAEKQVFLTPTPPTPHPSASARTFPELLADDDFAAMLKANFRVVSGFRRRRISSDAYVSPGLRLLSQIVVQAGCEHQRYEFGDVQLNASAFALRVALFLCDLMDSPYLAKEHLLLHVVAVTAQTAQVAAQCTFFFSFSLFPRPIPLSLQQTFRFSGSVSVGSPQFPVQKTERTGFSVTED